MSARKRACAEAADNPALHCADYDANARGCSAMSRSLAKIECPQLRKWKGFKIPPAKTAEDLHGPARCRANREMLKVLHSPPLWTPGARRRELPLFNGPRASTCATSRLAAATEK